MENASKALIFAASILIAIMIMSFMVFIFNRFNVTAKTTEQRFSQKEIEEFNANFMNYETGGNHDLNDTIGVTYTKGNREANTRTEYVKYGDLFREKTSNPYATTLKEDLYKKALVDASKTLLKVSDVVSAINDAINTNDSTSNHYKYNTLEVQNSVEIIVDLGEYKDSLNFNPSKYRYLVIEPNQAVKPKRIYGFSNTDISDDKQTNVTNLLNKFSEANEIKTYDMLEELRDTAIVTEGLIKTHTVHEYYFMGEVIVNDYTDLVESVRFKLVKDNNFASNEVDRFFD